MIHPFGFYYLRFVVGKPTTINYIGYPRLLFGVGE